MIYPFGIGGVPVMISEQLRSSRPAPHEGKEFMVPLLNPGLIGL